MLNALNCHNVAKYCKWYCSIQYRHRERSRSSIKMATFTGVERARCVFWFDATKSTPQVQRRFRIQYRNETPSRSTIDSWHKNFAETGCSVRHAKSPSRPYVSDATVVQLRSPRKSTRLGKRVRRVLPKRLRLKAYKLSIVQHLTAADKAVRKEFCTQMFCRIQHDERFLDSVILSDNSTFHSLVTSIPTTAGSGAAKIHVSS
jgi:hypothetical protein